MIAILLTFRDSGNGVAMESHVISRKELETESERFLAQSVDCGIAAAQRVIMQAISTAQSPATQLIGTDIENLAEQMMKKIHLTPILKALKKQGYDFPDAR